MRSLGRPPARRDVERACWAKVAEGLNSEDAAIACGMSGPVGSRWFQKRGGIPSIRLGPPSGRYLSFAEREEIALLRTQRVGVRGIARRLGRSPSTISRELRRNAATRSGRLQYRASIAQWKAELMARRPKTAKLFATTGSATTSPTGWPGSSGARAERRRPARSHPSEGSEQTPSCRSPVGHRVESGADWPPAAGELSRG